MTTDTPIYDFLTGRARNRNGYFFDDIVKMPNAWLEQNHEYIQWLFPLPESSKAVPHAPVLTPREIVLIRSDQRCIANLRIAAWTMLAFYASGQSWRRKDDHNHLRITRMIKSLRLLIDEYAAAAVHDQILHLLCPTVTTQTLRHWENAREGVAA